MVLAWASQAHKAVCQADWGGARLLTRQSGGLGIAGSVGGV